MQAGVGLLVTVVTPIFMIMPRYSHNYAQFYQLLDSNSFTPSLFSIILISRQQAISGAVYFAFFTLHLYHKNTKNIILSYLSDFTFVSDREGIDNPFIALVARFLFVCVGAWDSSVVSYWIDTLVLKN